ncbi:MAG: GNAT family N-acetyltransferase [Candidatus Cloacimonetes bacterium]|nr:GNAT family N-acetyltransferase [Candidatus Cloacimonadota bacterium]
MISEIRQLDNYSSSNITLLTDLSYLIYDFRHELAILKNKGINYTKENAIEEVKDYLITPYELYYISINEKTVAYLVLKIFDDTVWIEQLFTLKEHRRKHLAQKMIDLATKKAETLGKNTAFVNVHPNNEKMLKFLANQGYTVLNLLEIRKSYPNEKIQTKITITHKKTNQSFDFDY